jgi:N-acetylglucosamine kinase-like BadF-type ATPase
MGYFLGVDLGGTKTHMVIADEKGHTIGFGESGGGNHQGVGYEGMFKVLRIALLEALKSAGLKEKDITGAGFGIAGYDWPSQKEITMAVIDKLGLDAPYELVNDAIPGLVAGSGEGWGVGVVSGTGCNCRGWDREHKREGRVTGYGILMGEAAGGTELAYRAMQMVGFEWMQRGPKTALTDMFINYNGAKDLEDLLEGYTEGHYQARAEVAPLIFEVARQGDPVAQDLIGWAGQELGEMAISVIHQLEFEKLDFDVVLSGSMFEGGASLINPMHERIKTVAPGARVVRLTIPPVLGAVLLGMEKGGMKKDMPEVRKLLAESLQAVTGLGDAIEPPKNWS